MSSRVSRSCVALALALGLTLPINVAWAGPPPPTETDAEAEPDASEAAEATPEGSGVASAPDGSHPGGAYGESVDYGWDGSQEPPPPTTGPQVIIEVHNSLRPVYLQRAGTGEEVCEAPCNRRIGDASGQFVLDGPGRKGSKPFSLTGGDSLRLTVKGGKPGRAALGIVVMVVGVVGAIGLAVTPTRVNMPKGAGIGMWAGAGVVGVVGLASGFTLFRFSRTQVKVGSL